MMKIGIIGMSQGNAHPYSWSAIINGCYNAAEIKRIGYPAVSNYLKANEDTLGINGAKVTCVWTQDKKVSESIAQTTQIETIVNNLEEMVGLVDAVILARDDPQNHVAMAKPFIDADIPVFIDKPLAITLADLQYFSEQVANGKFIMSCSSMRYANEIRTVKQDIASLGKFELATAVGKKNWVKYGVHLLEALFSLLDDPKPISVKHIGKTGKDIVHVGFENGFQATMHLFADISSTFQISLYGQNGWRLIDIKNSYSMFRDNIIEFIRSVEEGKPRISFKKTETIVKTLMAAITSFEKGGETMYLTD